jgi:hypothetical protein
MPGSMPEGKQFIKDFLISKNVKRVMDVGPGSGNYVDLLSGTGEYKDYPGGNLSNVWWVGVEIFEAYITIFGLYNKYNDIIILDIFDLNWDQLDRFDVIILGDVIEHMTISRAREVIKQSAAHADWVILSLPIVDYPQGSAWGNEHEAHVEQYSIDRVRNSLLANYEIVDSYEGTVIGTYIFRKKDE